MASFRAAAHVKPHYPDAIKASVWIKTFLSFAKMTLGLNEEKIAFLTSICSDDLNSVELPDTDMVGPFVQGGLDGYPFAGKTGLGAFAHHVPEGGAALLFFGPHVGITDTGKVGMIVRPGQTKASACCGAAMAALKKLVAGGITPKPPTAFAVDDYQQETLEQIILAHESEILGPGTDEDTHFVRMTEVVFREMRDAMNGLLKNVAFESPAFAFGGILINEDAGRESSIALRNVLQLHENRVTDLTEQFTHHALDRFKELEASDGY